MVKNLPANAGDKEDSGSVPGLGRPPWSWARKPTLVLSPGESHGQRSVVNVFHRVAESDMTEAT